MGKIIVYVFGPKRIYDKYMSGTVLDKGNGEWLKIGLTRTNNDDDDPNSIALIRCKQESKTGLPETSYIFDVFEFPNFTNGKIDDDIRHILQEFNIESSMQNNKFINDDEIPAGQEFVYGLNRIQVLYAIKAYTAHIMVDLSDAQRNELINYMKKSNDDTISDESQNTMIPESTQLYRENNMIFWNNIYNNLADNVKEIVKVNPSDARNGYKYFPIKDKDNQYMLIVSHSSKRRKGCIVIENIRNMDNVDFYNHVNNNKLFDGMYTWRDWVRKSGNIEKQMLFYDAIYTKSPNDLVYEMAQVINNIYKYMNYV